MKVRPEDLATKRNLAVAYFKVLWVGFAATHGSSASHGFQILDTNLWANMQAW